MAALEWEYGMTNGLNQLIARGGRGVKSPVQRYLETKAQMQREDQNRLAAQSTRQQMGIRGQQNVRAQETHQAKQMEDYGKAVVPIMESINNSPDKQAAYTQAFPQIKQIATEMGVPTDQMSPQWDQTKADSFLSRFGEEIKAPKTTSVLEEVDGTTYKVNKEWVNGRWVETGRGRLRGVAGEAGSGSEFERLHNLLKSGKEMSEYQKKRLGVLSGTDMRKGSEERLKLQRFKQTEDKVKYLKKESNEGLSHFNGMRIAIDDSLAALDSGDTEVSDKLLAQVMSQVNDTNVRAFQMFAEFDQSYGNVAERTASAIGRFVSGGRTESDKAIIRETLENFRDSHISPGLNKLKNRYRRDARIEGIDPFRVVSPVSPEEIRDYQGMDRKEKVKYLKKYFPGKFK